MVYDFSPVVRQVVALLVERDYDGLERLTNANRLTADEIAEAVEEYGAALLTPPSTSFHQLDVVEVENASPKEWSVRMPLWAEGEGESDLSLELTLKKAEEGGYKVQIDNLHVL
jgi:hypothetical protein